MSRASAPGQAAALVERNKRRLAVQRATAELLSQCAAQRGRHDCETRTRLGVALHETLRQAGDAVVAAISERNPELWPASLTRAEAAVQRNEDVLGCADQDAVALVRAFVDSGKPVAVICHGPWVLVEAGVAAGRTLTSYPSLRTDLVNAGATVVDQEVAIDGNIITSRSPDDLPAFCATVIDTIAADAPVKDAVTQR